MSRAGYTSRVAARVNRPAFAKSIELRRSVEWKKYKVHGVRATEGILRWCLAIDGLEYDSEIAEAFIKRSARGGAYTYYAAVWAVVVPGEDRRVYEMVKDELKMIGAGRFADGGL